MQSKLGEVKKAGVFRLAYYAYIINQKSSQITLEILEFPKWINYIVYLCTSIYMNHADSRRFEECRQGKIGRLYR